jgi:hypothetical protein
MAFDRSMPTPGVFVAAPAITAEPVSQQPETPQKTLLERVAEREAAFGDAVPANENERKVSFADVLFATIITTLSVIAAIIGVTAALFLIGLGLAFYIVPIIAAVFVSVALISAVMLFCRKHIAQLSARMARRDHAATAQADLFLTA